MDQRDLSPSPYQPVLDEEVRQVLATAICYGGRLPRTADLHLSAICAEHLLDQLNFAGLAVVWRPVKRLCA